MIDGGMTSGKEDFLTKKGKFPILKGSMMSRAKIQNWLVLVTALN